MENNDDDTDRTAMQIATNAAVSAEYARLFAAMSAMRSTAAAMARGDVELLRRQGHHDAAEAHSAAASRILRIDVEEVITSLGGSAPSVDQSEMEAFDQAAREHQFNVTRRDDGAFVHPITQRVWRVWRAAAHWARSSAHAATT